MNLDTKNQECQVSSSRYKKMLKQVLGNVRININDSKLHYKTSLGSSRMPPDSHLPHASYFEQGHYREKEYHNREHVALERLFATICLYKALGGELNNRSYLVFRSYMSKTLQLPHNTWGC